MAIGEGFDSLREALSEGKAKTVIVNRRQLRELLDAYEVAAKCIEFIYQMSLRGSAALSVAENKVRRHDSNSPTAP